MVQLNSSSIWKGRTDLYSLYSLDSIEMVEPKEIRKRVVLLYSELYKCEHTDAEELASSFYGFA